MMAGNSAKKKLKLKLEARVFKFSMNIDRKKYLPTLYKLSP